MKTKETQHEAEKNIKKAAKKILPIHVYERNKYKIIKPQLLQNIG